MSMKWWTERSLLNRTRRRVGIVLIGVLLASALSGCALLPNESEEEALPTITPPKLSQKAEYTVTTQDLEIKLQVIGKLMSTQEETLFYTGGTGDPTGGSKRVKEVYVHTGDHVEAGQVVAQLDVTDLEQDLHRKQLQFRQQEIDMIKVLRNADQMQPEELEQKKIDFELQRSELQNEQDAINQAKIKAPFAGTVVELDVKKGDTVQSYAPIAMVADLTKLTVAAQVSADDLTQIAVGMDAIVDINNAGQFNGKVKQLPVTTDDNSNSNGNGGNGGMGQGSTGQQDSIDKYMLVQLDKMPKDVTRGTPLTVNVIVNSKKNAVVIPYAALRSHAGRSYVEVIDKDGTKREVDVEVGLQTPTVVEIKDGLTSGMKVVGP